MDEEKKLKIEDIKAGTGEAVKDGDHVVVHYTGWLEDGTKFDSSKDRGTPFEVAIGAGYVIKGWDMGIPGMKTGGKRKREVKGSPIPRSEIAEKVTAFIERFQLPQVIVEKAETVQGFFVQDAEMARLITVNARAHFTRRNNQPRNESLGLPLYFSVENVKRGFHRYGEYYYTKPDNTPVVLLQEESRSGYNYLLDNALLHALASHGFGNGAGFQSEVTDSNSGKHLDALVSDILIQTTKNPEQTAESVLARGGIRRVMNGRVIDDAEEFLWIVREASLSAEELARYFFGEGSAKDCVRELNDYIRFCVPGMKEVEAIETMNTLVFL